MDDYSTLRNDRYVLPVKASNKRAGLGIVHDTSGSGQTVFVEPLEIVEMNNDLKMADAALRQEELRIFRDLSDRVAIIAGDLAESLKAAAALDLIFAKAKLGQEVVMADFAEDGEMLDAIAITTGKGFQGHIKRWGVNKNWITLYILFRPRGPAL